jgi:hypothetical protein
MFGRVGECFPKGGDVLGESCALVDVQALKVLQVGDEGLSGIVHKDSSFLDLIAVHLKKSHDGLVISRMLLSFHLNYN